MHRGRRKVKGTGPVGKAIVQGLLERGGEVRAMVVANQKRNTHQATVRDNVEPGAAVYTDQSSRTSG